MKYLDVTLEVLLNSLILSFLAAMIRVMFSKIGNYKDTMSIFIGSILFGVIIGYILNDFEVLKKYLKIIIVVFSIFGKELYIWLEKMFADPGKNFGVIIAIFNGFKSLRIGVVPTKKEDNNDDAI